MSVLAVFGPSIAGFLLPGLELDCPRVCRKEGFRGTRGDRDFGFFLKTRDSVGIQ